MGCVKFFSTRRHPGGIGPLNANLGPPILSWKLLEQGEIKNTIRCGKVLASGIQNFSARWLPRGVGPFNVSKGGR